MVGQAYCSLLPVGPLAVRPEQLLALVPVVNVVMAELALVSLVGSPSVMKTMLLIWHENWVGAM